jgi:methyltransferase family protein
VSVLANMLIRPDEAYSDKAGWLAMNGDRLALLGILAVVKPRTVVQVGVWEAADVATFQHVLPGVRVHGIDKDPKPRAVERADAGLFSLVIRDSADVLKDLLVNVRPDLVYVDGDHGRDRVLWDLRTSLENARHAHVVVHDYRHMEVYEVVQEWVCNAIATCNEFRRHET